MTSPDGDDDAFYRALPQWLPPKNAPVSAYSAFDLSAFLQATSSHGVAPAERLRLLAAYLDDERFLTAREQPQAWEVFQRIFDQAERLSGGDIWVLKSRALAATNAADYAGRAAPLYSLLLAEARNAAARATAIDPEDGGAWRMLGNAHYREPDGTAEALACYQRALACDASDAWAQLYLAHCLHDFERFTEAAAAYDAVDQAVFAGPQAWRMERLREQRADCYLRSGDRAGALRAFEEFLVRREQALARGESWSHSPYLLEPMPLLERAAAGELRAELGERVQRQLGAELAAIDADET